MLNGHELPQKFKTALSRSWDEAAIWPGCKDGYIPGESHPSYGQCLVGTLATLSYCRQNYDTQFSLAAGEAIYPNGDSVWHFQLTHLMPNPQHRLTAVPIDVTWDQFPEGTTFQEASDWGNNANRDKLAEILIGSFWGDDTLVDRTQVIVNNLRDNGISIRQTGKEIVVGQRNELLRRYNFLSPRMSA